MFLLFDVDGTLTIPRNKISDHIKNQLHFIKTCKKNIKLGIVSGSDLIKLREQIGEDIFSVFDYVFSENGLVYYYKGECKSKMSLLSTLGEERYQTLINSCLSLLPVP